MDIAENEFNEQLAEAFILGQLCVFEAFDIEPPPAREGEKLDDLLREIAQGERTIRDPDELLRDTPMDPTRRPGLTEMVYRNVNELIARDRALAARIWDGYNRIVDRACGG
jgi:hypothetical protein